LEEFLDSSDLHLLADSTEGVTVGSIYRKDPSESKARRIGDVTNFLDPPVSFPELKKGSQQFIHRDFRQKKSLGIVVNTISRFISSLGFSLDSAREQILEVNYDDVTFEAVDPAVVAKKVAFKKFDVNNLKYRSDSEYYIVTKTVKSSNFRVNLKRTKNLATKLSEKIGQPIAGGLFKMELAQGTLDEVTMTYSGKNALVFAVHLERLDFDKGNGAIMRMEALSQAVKLLGKEDRIWESCVNS
jgi:hypothetical protein